MTLLPPYLVFGPAAGIALTVVFLLRIGAGRQPEPSAGAPGL